MITHIAYWIALFALAWVIVEQGFRLRQAQRDIIEQDNRWRSDWIRGMVLQKAETVKEFTRNDAMTPPPSVEMDEDSQDTALDAIDEEQFDHQNDYSLAAGGPGRL